VFQDELQANLNYLIDEHSSEGSWDHVLSWSEFYPQELDKEKIGGAVA
jgi:hypothetical protein